VQVLLKSHDGQHLPQRGIGLDPANKRYYYYSAIPIVVNNEMVGVIVVGTSLNTLLFTLKNTSLADLIFYGENGLAVGTTLAGRENDSVFLSTLSISPDLYQKIVDSENIVNGENFITDGRWYSLARGALRVSGDQLGTFGVILPL